MDHSSWKTSLHNITGLELDPKNPRLPGVGRYKSTRDIVAVLLEHEDVLGLAKSIVEFGGLYPSERLIVVEENGDKVVVEGNRRLAALKLIESPDLAPPTLVEKFRALRSKIGPIQKAEIVTAPTRSAAARLIVARHAGDSLRRWLPAQQARFIRTLVDGNLTIEEAAQEIKMTPGEIRNFLRMDTMLRLAYVMTLDDVTRNVLESHDKFSFSTLERFVTSSEGQGFLGISFDGEGNAVGHLQADEFKKGYTRVVTDIAKGDVDTRKLNKSDDIKAYLKGISAAKPNHSKKDTWTSTELLSGSTTETKKAIKAATKMVKKPKSESFLIPRGFSCGIKSQRIKEIFAELRRLKIADYPNACAVLLRIFAEMAVGHHLDKTGKSQPLYEKAKKEGKKPDWAPTLRQLMRVCLEDKDLKVKALNRKALNRMVNDDESLLSLDHIDQYVHNRYVAPKERDLRSIWETLEPLLEQYMEEPPAPTGAGS